MLGFRTAMKIAKGLSLIAPAIVRATHGDSPHDTAQNIMQDYTGFSGREDWPKFEFGRLLAGWGPFIGVNLVDLAISFMLKMKKDIA